MRVNQGPPSSRPQVAHSVSITDRHGHHHRHRHFAKAQTVTGTRRT